MTASRLLLAALVSTAVAFVTVYLINWWSPLAWGWVTVTVPAVAAGVAVSGLIRRAAWPIHLVPAVAAGAILLGANVALRVREGLGAYLFGAVVGVLVFALLHVLVTLLVRRASGSFALSG